MCSITLEGNCIFNLQRFPCSAFDVDLNEHKTSTN